MEANAANWTGLGLMFILGLRHGLDPDHIAVIDNLSLRSLRRAPSRAPWTGTLFALGHGLTITGIAVLLQGLNLGQALPETIQTVLSWLPTFFLLLISWLNLRQLRRPNNLTELGGWKHRLLPQHLRENDHPLVPLAIGLIFALVFETATQAAAWGYAASESSGPSFALVAGLAFTAGMVITDSMDSRLFCWLYQQTQYTTLARRYRHGLGWLVVIFSFSVATYTALEALTPTTALNEFAWSLIGLAMVVAIALALLYLYGFRCRNSR